MRRSSPSPSDIEDGAKVAWWRRPVVIYVGAVRRSSPSPSDTEDGAKVEWWHRPVVIFLVFAAVVQLILAWWLVSTRFKSEHMFVISAAIFAAAIYYTLFQFVADRDLRKLLDRAIDKHHNALVRIEERHHSELRIALSRQVIEDQLPVTIYPPRDDWDPRFNEDLTTDLQTTRVYYFRGASAVHLPTRVRYREVTSTTPQFDVKIIITDPTSDQAIERVLRDRRTRPQFRRWTEDQIREDVIDDIHMAVVALFSRRSGTDSIEVLYEAGTRDARIELVDTTVYETHFTTSRTARFPRVVAYSSRHARYRFLSEEFSFLGDQSLGSRHDFFTRDSGDDDLYRHLRTLWPTRWPNDQDVVSEVKRLQAAHYQKYDLPFSKEMVRLKIWDAGKAKIAFDDEANREGDGGDAA